MRAGATAVMMGALLLVGCGRTGGSPECFEVCENFNECKIDQRAYDVECKEFCPDVEEFGSRAEAAGFSNCETEFNAHLDCWQSNAGSICDPDFEGCVASADAWVACMEPYCASVPLDKAGTGDEPGCYAGDEENPPTPALAPF